MTYDTSISTIDLIYDAITDSQALAQLPAAVAAVTGSDSSWLMGDLSFTLSAPAKPSISCAHGLDDDVVRHYERGEYLRDPWLDAGPKVQLNKPVSMARFVDEHSFKAGPMYNEFLRGRADVLHCMALAVPVADRIIVYAMQRGSRGRAYDENDEAKLDILRPHLGRLLRAQQLRKKNGLTSPTVFDALLIGPDPVFLCNDEAHVVHLNVPAADLVAIGEVVHMSAAGRLMSTGEAMNMHHAVRDATRRGIPTLNMSMHENRRWIIRVDPAQDGSKTAVVHVRDVSAHIKRQVDTAKLRFGFTDAETSLATSLASGLSLEHHAHFRHIKMPTVRSQMSALLAKSGSERQAQLIATIHEMPPSRG